MSPMFGGKKKDGRTIALIDIESGSVASALARLSRHEAPKLFAETRVKVPVRTTRNTEELSRGVEEAIKTAISHTSAVAARLRANEAVAPHGEVDGAAVFFAPPWASMHLTGGTAEFVEPMRRSAHLGVRSTLGEIPTTFHPFGTAAAHGSVLLFPNKEPVMLCIVSGEVSELLIVSPKALLARATVPVGTALLVRTLMTHGGMSAAEANSYLALPRQSGHILTEPLVAAEDYIAAAIADVAEEAKGDTVISNIIVVGHEPLPELLAQALARHEHLATLFPQGGVVRTMRAQHAMPYIAAHARTPDLNLMLEALFIDAKLSGI